jgi:hypothetical protein
MASFFIGKFRSAGLCCAMLKHNWHWSLHLVVVWLVAGCSTHTPRWDASSFAPQPCAAPEHGHVRGERQAEELKSVEMDLSRYKSAQEREGQDTNLFLAVAISGGGERSANFAVGVLLELENLKHEKSNALKEIDYFSTVSGFQFQCRLHELLPRAGLQSRKGIAQRLFEARLSRQHRAHGVFALARLLSHRAR